MGELRGLTMRSFVAPLAVVGVILAYEPSNAVGAYDEEIVDAPFSVQWRTSASLVDSFGNSWGIDYQDEFYEADATARLRFGWEEFLYLYRLRLTDYVYSLNAPFFTHRIVSIPGTNFSKQLSVEIADWYVFYDGIAGGGDLVLVDDPALFNAAFRSMLTRIIWYCELSAMDFLPREFFNDGFPDQNSGVSLIADADGVLAHGSQGPFPSCLTTFNYSNALEISGEMFSVKILSMIDIDYDAEFMPVPEPSRWLLLAAGLGCLVALYRVRMLR